MSIDRWSRIRFVHVLSAMGWVGGQLLLSGVVIPALRSAVEPDQRRQIVRATAHRFTQISILGLLPLLLVTGISMAVHRGVTWSTFGEPGYGRLLGIKLVLVVASFGLAAVHGIIAARRPTSARFASIGGLAASVGVVVYATALVP